MIENHKNYLLLYNDSVKAEYGKLEFTAYLGQKYRVIRGTSYYGSERIRDNSTLSRVNIRFN